ncbi:hypothetical protein [Streptomyces fungicidicus]|uniref:hypothetical protein n=1 Tax=Streptomyces fungicidicus TaxID=68203 RepID=UPI00382FD340
MADEQYRWLNRRTAERLLSGEPPEPADPAARDQARQLAATLRALSPPPPSADDELPGEAAALAAFRKLREEREGRTEAAPDSGRLSGTHASDVGLIHIGAPRDDRSGTADGPRRLRPLRLGLAAALVAGMVGGAAALAGTGALTGPSGGPGSDPAASATATGTHPEQPLLSPSSTAGATPGGEHPESVAGTAGGEVDATGGGEEDAGGPGAPGKPGPDPGDGATRTGRSGKQIAAACRAWRDGKHLNATREHLLEKAAGGSSRVGTYCDDVLTAYGASGGDQGNQGNGNGNGNGNGEANGRNKGQGQSHGNGSGNDDGDAQGSDGNNGGNGNGNGGGNSQ